MQLAPGLLLQRGGHKRRVRFARVRLLLHCGDVHGRGAQRVGKRVRLLLIDDHRLALQPPPVIEVAALGDALAVEGDELRVEGFALLQLRDQVPVLRRDERHALAFALDNHAGGHGLDAAGGQARHDLLPQHRRDFVAVEAVEDAAGFLRVDEVHVQLAGVFGGFADGGFGDLVEHHALHRHLRLQGFQKVPGDRFAFAVRVSREQELVGLLELGFEVGDLLFLVRVDDVDRREAVLGVDAEFGPRFLLVLGGDVGGSAGQVADVADGGFHNKVVAQILLDLLRLRRGLHND